MNKSNQNTKEIIITIASIIVIAALGSIFVNIGMEWFNDLDKPSQWIPNIVIPIVWSIIYITFGILLIRMINKQELNRYTKILLIINGILNVLWCLTFFTLHWTFVGNIVIVLNCILAFTLVLNIKKYNQLYSLILYIYPIWVSIATTLNLALWILN